MEFQRRLLRTLEAIQPVLDEVGVLVVGSQVPNLIEPAAATTLVVSQGVDVGVPVQSHAAVKERLRGVRRLHPSVEEPSVWIPDAADLFEVNFVGMDPTLQSASEAYILEDSELPMLVFGALSARAAGAAVRAWEYRQRNHAKGTWYRLRRLLADASVAYALTEQAARELLAEGYRSDPAGERLEPPKTILCVPEDRIDALAGKRQIPVRLAADFLAARYVALVGFETDTKLSG